MTRSPKPDAVSDAAVLHFCRTAKKPDDVVEMLGKGGYAGRDVRDSIRRLIDQGDVRVTLDWKLETVKP